MGLEDGDETAVGVSCFGGFEGGLDFSGVVGVVVEVEDISMIFDEFEAALSAGESFEGGDNFIGGNFEAKGGGEGGGGVAQVVRTRQGQV